MDSSGQIGRMSAVSLSAACSAAMQIRKRLNTMDQQTRRALMALPIVLFVAAALALAGSQGGTSVSGIPLFALCIVLAFVIQWVAFIPAFVMQTERYYDLTGSITYITVTTVAVMLSPATDARPVLLLLIVVVWAIRLGTFLFRRIRATGADERFDNIKPSFAGFLLAWTLQGLWVSFSLAAALAAITSATKQELGLLAVIGLVVWLLGFGIEVVADWQKSRFRAAPENAGRFINAGLWSWSRHPNYFGEIVLWIGVAIIALPVLRNWQLVTLISPVFITILLTRISGVPLLEARADEKWGGQADYEAYKARTPVLIPRPPSAS
jgi:steroid 5-alpha reductase family enzyme